MNISIGNTPRSKIKRRESKWIYRDEELRPIGVLPSIGHGEPASAVVLQLEVLIGEPGGKKDSRKDLKLFDSYFSP